MRNTLRKNFTIIIYTVSGLLLVSFFLYNFAMMRYDYHKSETERVLSQNSAVKIRIIENQINEKLGDINLIGGDSRLLNAVNEVNSGKMLSNASVKILTEIAETEKIENITYVSADMSRIVILAGKAEKTDTALLRNLLNEIPPHIQSICADPDLHSESSFRHLHFVRRLISEDGINSGYIIFHFEINSVFPEIFEFYSNEYQANEMFLVIGDQNMVHYSGKNHFYFSINTTPGKKFAGILAAEGKTGFYETTDFRGEEVFAMISDIPSLKANLLLLLKKSEAAAAYKSELISFAILLSGVLLASFFGYMYLSARNRRKLNETEKEKKFILQQFEFVSNFSNEAILLFDGNFKLLYSNHKISSFYNITHTALRTHLLGALYQKISGIPLDFSTLESKKIVSSETEVTSAAGEPLFLEITCRKISNNINTIFHLNIKDITEKKKSLKDLENSEKRYRELTETMSDFAFSLRIDASGKIKLEWITESFDRISGYTRDERIRNEGYLYPVESDDLELFTSRMITAAGGRSNLETEVRLTTKSAETKWVKLSVKPVSEITPGGEIRILGLGRDITGEKRLLLEVEENSKKIELIFENSFEATLLVKDQQIELVNRSLLKLFGYSDPAEILNKPVTTIVAEKHRKLITAYLLKRAYADSPHTTYFALGLKKDGSQFEAELSISHYSVGVEKYLIVMIRDISVKLATEKRIRESEEKYRTLANQVPVGIYRINAAGEMLYFNKTFGELFKLGSQTTAIRTLNLADMYDDSFIHEIKLKKIASTRDVYSSETVMKKSSGENIYVKEKASGIFDEAGNLLYIDGIIEDITEFKKTIDKTIANYQLFRTVWDNTREGFRLTDEDGKIVMVNKSFCELFSMEQNELTGQLFNICYKSTEEKTISKYKERFMKREILPEFEVEVQIRNGDVKWMEISTSFIDLESSRPLLLTIFKDSTERQKALELLKQNELRFKNLAVTLPVGILIYNKEKKVIFCNDTATHIFRLSQDQINGSTYTERYSAVYDSKGNKVSYDEFPTALAFKTKSSVINSEIGIIVKGQDELKWLKVNAIPQFDSDENIEEVVVAIDDITKEKNTIDEIRKLKMGIEQSPVSVVITDTAGSIEYVNPFFSEVTGYSLSEAIGKNPSILKSGFQSEEIYRHLWTEISSGKVWRGELQNRKKNGEIYWESVSISPIRDEDNIITHYVAVKDDITEQKKSAEELLLSKNNLLDKLKKLELIQRIYSKFSLNTDVREIFTGINELLPDYYSCDFAVIKLEDPETKKLYGVERFGLSGDARFNKVSAILGEFEKECLNSDKPVIIDDPASGDFLPGEYVTGLELKALVLLKIRYKNDPIGVLEVFYTEREFVLRADDIEFLNMVANLLGILLANALSFENLKDIQNNLILAKERAEEMNRIKSTFLANLSHELRTPLINIIGYAEIIMDSIEEDEELKMMADSILKGGTRLKDTLNSLLELSKLEANAFNLNLVEVNVEKLIDEAVSKNAHKAEEKGLYINKDCVVSNPVAHSDAVMLESIIEHLISNAIKYTEEGGVSLELYEKIVRGEECFILRVSDTGIGISPENQTKIFEDFRQASEGYARQYEGAGIGLAIVSKYCKILRGTIEVESESGVGSAFTVTIPRTPKSY